MRVIKSLPLDLVPAADRAAWESAFVRGDIFDGSGPAWRWSAGSRRSVLASYRNWLGHLARVEPSALSEPAGDRVTAARVANYVEMLEATISPAGTHNYIKHLYDALRVMVPAADWRWLSELAKRIASSIKRRPKRYRMVSVERAFALGIDLMARAEAAAEAAGIDDDSLAAPLLYRDGLIIALLARRPLRRRNIAMIRIGQHLLRVGDGYVLRFMPDDMKTHRAFECAIPVELLPHIKRYLEVHRRRIPGALGHDGLWASQQGCPMGAEAIYTQVRAHTRTAFGVGINLHLFRDILATDLAIEDPLHIGLAKDLLGHARLSTVEQHYNQAESIEASRSFQDILDRRHGRRGGLRRPHRTGRADRAESS